MASKKQTGQNGEHIAVQFLQKQGYDIVATNWHCKQGEIDIIAQIQGRLAFVEVRTRSTSIEQAFESVHSAKQKRMVAAAYQYLQTHGISDDVPWQIDLIAVVTKRGYAPTVKHVEDALDW